MYKEHPVFIQPANGDIKVWRYLDFTKLISIIDTQELFFARADKFDDPFEGSWPKINVDARTNDIPLNFSEEQKQQYLRATSNIGNLNAEWPKYTAINCWHANEYESAAMWKLYLKSNEGVAIQSTYSRYKESIIDEREVYIGAVSYIDYQKDFIDASNLLGAFVHKRKSFEHEREIRGVVMKWPSNKKENMLDFSDSPITHGISMKIDINILVENIYIAPNAPTWFLGLVTSVIKKYGYNFNVIQSELGKNPIF